MLIGGHQVGRKLRIDGWLNGEFASNIPQEIIVNDRKLGSYTALSLECSLLHPATSFRKCPTRIAALVLSRRANISRAPCRNLVRSTVVLIQE